MRLYLHGYPNEMQEFLDMNQGLASRINFNIQFEDYNEETLFTIFKNMCKAENYKLAPQIKDLLIKHFEVAKEQERFGNGRYVKNLYEHCKIIQSNRVIADGTLNQNLIIVSDVKEALSRIESQEPKQTRRIGF